LGELAGATTAEVSWNGMRAYRVYILGDGGIDLPDCLDDKTAKAGARQLPNEHPVELWHGNRQIATTDPTSPR
jgi:hypothetical protein